MNPNHTTRAQNMWRQVLAGRADATDTIRDFCSNGDDAKLADQIASMPDDMLAALIKYVEPISPDETGYSWPPEVLGVSMPLLHIFNFDFFAAEAWKLKRIQL